MLLSIDPGLNLGWAFWDSGHRFPMCVGTAKGNGKTWQSRWANCFAKFKNDLFIATHHINHISKVLIEYPGFFASAHGQMVAQRGDLIKLTYFVGWLASYLSEDGAKVRLVTVSEWKGQLPKNVTQDRIRSLLGNKRCKDFTNSHIWDAVGIGLFEKGLF